jgi:hypothetical protein
VIGGKPVYYDYCGREIEDLEMANMRRDAREAQAERSKRVKKRGSKPKSRVGLVERQDARLEQEIRATADLIARHVIALTAEQRQALYLYLRKLAQVAAALTVLPTAEQEAIKALCDEVLILAEGEAVVSYVDELRAKVRAISFGEQVWRARYSERDQAGV